jgi:tetratricopeptide (TPR) repeat protein
MAAFYRALEINDGYVMAYAGLALAQDRSGRSAESLETLRLAETIAPGSEKIYARLADVGLQMAMENRRPAASAADRAWAGNRFANLRLPGALDENVDETLDAESEAAADEAIAQVDHDEKVRVQLEKHRLAVERFPRYADLHYYYGLLLAGIGRTDEALEQYRAAVEINPQYTEALIRLALAYWRIGRVDEARHALAKADAAEAEQLSSHYRFGILWADRGVWPLVLEQLESQAMSQGLVNGAIAAATQNLGVSDSRSRDYLASLKLADHRDQRQGSAVAGH